MRHPLLFRPLLFRPFLLGLTWISLFFVSSASSNASLQIADRLVDLTMFVKVPATPVEEYALDGGFLGVRYREAERVDQKGVQLYDVVADSPAANGGLQVGDTALTLNDKPITMSNFSQLVTHLPGEEVALKILRNGKELTQKITLGKRSMLVQQNPPRVLGTQWNAAGDFAGNITGVTNVILTKSITLTQDFLPERFHVLECKISGTEDFTTLTLTKEIKLEGLLYVTLDEFQPKANDAFELISGGKKFTGRFHKVLLPELPENLRWEMVYDDLKNGHDFDQDGKHDVTIIVRGK